MKQANANWVSLLKMRPSLSNKLGFYRVLCVLGVILLGGCAPKSESVSGNEPVEQKQQNDEGQSSSKPPNIVLILTDDQAYADTSGFGQEAYQTPSIDSIAQNGAMLTQFYVAQPVCSSSRAAILTGAYPNRIGVFSAFFPTPLTDTPDLAVGLNPDEETLPELLKEVGYQTALFGKWHLGDTSPFLPIDHGFDEFYGIPYSNDMWSGNTNGNYSFDPLPVLSQDTVVKTLSDDQSDFTTELTEKSVSFINNNSGKPFFMMLAHPQPHVPLFVSDKFKGKSGAGLYGDVMMEIDWSTEQILQALDDNGLTNNTIVIFMSDNGPWLTFGEHAGDTGGLRNGKLSTFEGGIRSPTHIQWPAGLAKQGAIDTPMMTIDLLPTLTRLAGAPLPEKKIDGKDIWPIISGKQDEAAHEAYFFYFHKNDLAAVRYKNWKLLYPHRYSRVIEVGKDGRRGNDDFPMLDGMMLFDLDKDPYERTNLVLEHPEIVAEIDALAVDIRKELGDDLQGVAPSEKRPLGRHVLR